MAVFNPGAVMDSNLFLVVMAGGSGTRFWPKSTSKNPKQFLQFGEAKTLLQKTVDRFQGWVPEENTIIVTTQSLSPIVREQVSARIRVLEEPQARNTAPCLFWATKVIEQQNPNAVMMIMPSDHSIRNVGAFVEVLKQAVGRAREQADLITLGVKPTRPETGYGYLRLGQKLEKDCLKVDAFVEKPSLSRAEEFHRSQNYLWNGGMFVCRVSSLLEAFNQFMPEMEAAWSRFNGQIDQAYSQMTATSIDYGIMEKAKSVVTFPLDCGWDDLGSWLSLEALAEMDEKAKTHPAGVVNDGQCVAIDSTHCIVDVPGKVVALLGVHDLIIVEHGEALLIAQKNRSQEIRQVVDAVKKIRPDLV